MNLSKAGATLLVAITLAGSVDACANTTTGKAVSQEHDKLYDWVTDLDRSSIKPFAFKLGVDDLYLVQPSLDKAYYAVGTLGDRCLVSFTRPDKQGKMEIKIFGRRVVLDKGIKPLTPAQPLSINGEGRPKQTAWFWVSSQYIGCVTQSRPI
ncbi:MAG: hypothetical protein JWN75_887 [Candidatus Saccharibacteria bacterium]|nr:hypothetical protein [Candidatus Saccharibacteria bacterium]